MKALLILLAVVLDLVPKGPAILTQLQKRDSVLVADRLEYGFELDSVAAGTALMLQDFSSASNDTLTVVRGWKLDTLGRVRRDGSAKIRGSIVIAPFEEGIYSLPPILVRRNVAGDIDTLMFSAPELEVKAIPIDTTTFVPHDIKGQIGYRLTFGELLPWILGIQGIVLLAILIWALLSSRARKKEEAVRAAEPAHIVALRELDRYRGDKFWAPDRQKAFYSGVTDTLKTYIGRRFGVGAPEMTTAELFDALAGMKDITPSDYADTKALFETADFVKFAKHTVDDSENARVLPVAVRFVSDTYQTTLEEGQGTDVL